MSGAEANEIARLMVLLCGALGLGLVVGVMIGVAIGVAITVWSGGQ